jgi:Tol biopolymer transport system component
LWIAPTGGGEPRALTTLDDARHEVIHTAPMFLPGNRTILFASLTSLPGTERIEAVGVKGGARSVVVERATTPIWSPTGHLLFVRDGAVLATAFDEKAVQAHGDAIRVFPPGLIGATRVGGLALRLTANGTLLFVPREIHAQRLVSVARDGSARTLDMPLGHYEYPRLSADARRLAISSDASYLETLNLERGTLEQLTTAALGTGWPVWIRDGSRVVYRRYSSLFSMSTDGTGKQGEVKGTISNDYPSAAGPDADSVLVTRIRAETSGDVFLLSLTGAFAPRPLLASRAYEGGAQLSPDRRWLAYVSNETGRFEIHVSRFPGLDHKWQVSEGGGTHPRWSATGKEIFYRGESMVTAVSFDGKADELCWESLSGSSRTSTTWGTVPLSRTMMLPRRAAS